METGNDDSGMGSPAKNTGEDESSGSESNRSEKHSLDQDSQSSTHNHEKSPEVSLDDVSCKDNDDRKDLEKKLSAALSEVRAKEDLTKQHAKVAEEAISGWEKAEAEVSKLKQQLENTSHKNTALEDRVGHLDGALKECVRQLRQAREEQEQKVQEALTAKASEWKSSKLKLEGRVAELESMLESTKTELSAFISAEHDFQTKLDALEKENSNLMFELFSQSEQLKIETMEKELSIQAAETASKQHLESIKKTTKLEAECRRLRATTRKTQPCNDHKPFVNTSYVESLTDSHSDSGERMLTSDNEPNLSDSWASALISELDHFKNEKNVDKSSKTSHDEIELMDDFLEMERLVSLPEIKERSPVVEIQSGADSYDKITISKEERELALRRTAELEEKIEKIEGEKAQIEIALSDTQERLQHSSRQLEEMEVKLSEMQRQLDSECAARMVLEVAQEAAEADRIALERMKREKAKIEIVLSDTQMRLQQSSKQLEEMEVKLSDMQRQMDGECAARKVLEVALEAAEAEKTTLETKLRNSNSEVQQLTGKLHLVEMMVEKERAFGEDVTLKCEKLEEELLRKKQEDQYRRAACSSGELKTKQEKELVVAAEKLAECQHTIASLGQQLKSLASSDDIVFEAEKLDDWKSPIHRDERLSLVSSNGSKDGIYGLYISSNGKERQSPSSSSSSSSSFMRIASLSPSY